MQRSPKVIQQAQAHGRHLLAANDPRLSDADRALAAMFDGPLESESARDFHAHNDQRALQLQIAAQGRADWRA